ncbi:MULTISPECIES: hypothetical protein [unclassified Vibrio]|uniref:hypothetical protein n=1 Tax=unclassified Vibrio TaxID=2614977 RepID=UPI0013614888|nr:MULTISPECIES: hypothetical protein [unclassified Vibrio]NAW56827.1 hypothetical protein [Vibrio sp. V36_P2S2PM302]NAX25849.1 hypothetical protein [Vibrio sp. V38_P2S17PM301]NAX32163.1 hypothetical protein [Vibrio sp. V37_P2S8PM304]
MKFIGKLSTNNQNSEEFISVLERFLLENVDEYSGDLIGDLEYIHARAECYEGIKLESLSKVCEGEYQLDYSYNWFVYNGCADMDESDCVQNSTFVYVDEDGNVEVDIPDFQERTTVEEF